jgi:hypothetical protein
MHLLTAIDLQPCVSLLAAWCGIMTICMFAPTAKVSRAISIGCLTHIAQTMTEVIGKKALGWTVSVAMWTKTRFYRSAKSVVNVLIVALAFYFSTHRLYLFAVFL